MTLLEATDMSRDQMPKLFEGTDATGTAHAQVAKAWGMPKRPVVAGGGGDNPAAACGIGAVKPGAAFVSLGTSGVLFVSNEHFMPNAARAVHAFCHAVPDTWHQMGVILSAAASLEWLAGLLKTPAPKLTAALGKKLDGPSSALFLPYLSGERTPVADAQIRGPRRWALAMRPTPRSLTHAVLDGVAFAFRDSLEALKAAGTTSSASPRSAAARARNCGSGSSRRRSTCRSMCRRPAISAAPLARRVLASSRRPGDDFSPYLHAAQNRQDRQARDESARRL